MALSQDERNGIITLCDELTALVAQLKDKAQGNGPQQPTTFIGMAQSIGHKTVDLTISVVGEVLD